jgi:amino acid adenylation domain-containing protein
MRHHSFLLSHLVLNGRDRAHRVDDLAAVCGEESVTWAGLERRVGQLAAALNDVGVERGDRVGIHLHKSIESLVAVHGIWRAGAAYVPIDALAPPELMASIIDDCGIEVLVSHQPRHGGLARLMTATPDLGIRAVVGLDDAAGVPGLDSASSPSWSEVYRTDPVSLGSPALPANVADDLAYVMYTSGSTGRPKGIMHTHRSGLAYATMSAELYGLGPLDRVANFSPLHFDMSTFEVFSAVGAGSRVVLIPEPHLRMPASLTHYLEQQRVTTLYTVPSLFQAMMTRGGLAERDLSSVRWVLPAGEVYAPGPLRELMAVFPQARFGNVYGPAEVNQCTYSDFTDFYRELDRGPGPSGTGALPVIPLGEAAPDAELELIDEHDRIVEGPGTGELIVRTSTMMAGYWNRPDLTAAAVLRRTGPGGAGRRWYRTGDLVERTADGQLVFHGRRDNQVKVRGNRVELEMVEAAAGSLDGVDHVVVGVVADADGESRLIARVTVTDGVDCDDVTVKQWRSALARSLPPYAVPVAFEMVDRLPKTPSGKIDRRTVRQSMAG